MIKFVSKRLLDDYLERNNHMTEGVPEWGSDGLLYTAVKKVYVFVGNVEMYLLSDTPKKFKGVKIGEMVLYPLRRPGCTEIKWVHPDFISKD